MAIFHGNAIPSGDTEYTIDYSARWDHASSPYGYWTPSGAGDSTEFTISFWYKVASVGSSVTRRTLFSAGPVTHNEFVIGHGYNGTGDQINIQGYISGSSNFEIATNRLHRDPSGWYHIVVAVDTSQGTASNKLKLYINGVEETSFATDGRGSMGSNQIVNSTVRHEIGRFARVAGHCHNGYLAEFHSVDGTALTADSFGEFDEDYGHWKPIAYTGSHGTNGFYLDFKSSTLGNDAAGSNNFTTPSVNTSDQMLDTPTNNFPTYNPLTKASGHTFAEGNLKVTGSGGHRRAMSTIGFDSGKWYYEVLIKTYGGTHPAVGVVTTIDGGRNWSTYTGTDAGGFGYYTGGVNHNSSTNGGTYSTYTTGDIIGVACDMDNLKVYFYKNGSNAITSGTAYETLAANTTYAFSSSTYGSGVQIANFGQDGTFAGEKTAQGNADGEGYGNFYYTPPTGFLALCTKNLPEPAVVPRDNFEAVIYTGNNAAGQVVTTSFEPDLVWNKIRNGTYHHRMMDRVRGFTNSLYTNGNYAENNYTDYGYITASSATSVTIGQGTHSGNLINDTGNNGVFWNWKANGAGSSNTDGSITSTVSANVSAGFSIVSYTGDNASSATIGHGLSKAPELIILKPRNKVDDWLVGSLQPARSWDWTDYMCLQLTDNVGDHTFWNDTAPTASVFSVGTSNTVNGSYNYIAYCFHDVEGYSKIGSYMGGGTASQGVFIYTGFKPAFVMIKSTNRNSSSWNIYDTARSPDNQTNERLRADDSATESTNLGIDIISNGFTPKTIDGQTNTGNGHYMYMAFAEMPLKYANARS